MYSPGSLILLSIFLLSYYSPGPTKVLVFYRFVYAKNNACMKHFSFSHLRTVSRYQSIDFDKVSHTPKYAFWIFMSTAHGHMIYLFAHAQKPIHNCSTQKLRNPFIIGWLQNSYIKTCSESFCKFWKLQHVAWLTLVDITL